MFCYYLVNSLLDGLGAVGAASGIEADGVVLVGAEAAVTGLADRLGNSRDGVRGVHILVVDGDLAAVGDGEGVAGLLACRQGGVDQLRGLCAGSACSGLSAERGERAGEAVGRVGRVVLQLCLADGADGLDCRCLVCLFAELEELRHGEGHEDKHDGHDDEEFDECEACFGE